MKSRTQRISIGSTLFILMLVAAVAIIRPIYIRAGEALSSLEKQLVEKAETLTGFSFSYQSLSPSILSAINIKGIVVSDTSSGKKMAEVKRVTVAYNFLDLFSLKQKGAINPAYAIRSVTINGVTVEYDALTDEKTVAGFVEALRAHKKTDESKKTHRFDLHDLNIDLPFLVQVKNLSVHYADQNSDVLATLKNLSLRNSFDASGIMARGSGTVSYRSPHVKNNTSPILMAAQFDLNGTVLPEFDGSSATIRLSSANNADLTVSRMDVLVDYSDLKMQMRTMRSVLPFSVFALFDFHQQTFDVSGSFDHFNPYQLIRMRHAPSYLEKFDGSRLTGTATVSSANHNVSYKTDIVVAVTKNLLGAEEQAIVRLDGTKDVVQIHQLSASGPVLQADFTGDFTIRTVQPSGILSCEYYVLPNGKALSAEVYIDPLDEGFMLFSPQVFMGDRSLSGIDMQVFPLQQSLDFTFSAGDYSHSDYDETGQILVSGSVLMGTTPYLQAQIELKNIFLDSAALTGAFFVNDTVADSLEKLAPKLEPYIMTDELYLSSDFQSVTFNAPVCIVGNIQNDRQMLTFAVDGSNQTVQVSSLDLLYDGNTATASLTADFSSGFDSFSFFGDFLVNALPYRFSGNYASNWLSIAGDYDFDALIGFGDETVGSVRFTALPVPAGKLIASLSTNATFTRYKNGDFTVELIDFAAEDISGFFRLNPTLSLVGTVNQYGCMLSNIAYSDAISMLNGVGSILWNVNDGIFDSVHIDMNAASPLTMETLSLLADITNPAQVPLSGDTLKNDFYISAQADIEAFPIARFVREQSSDNTLSMGLTATGTVRNPFISVGVRNISAGLYGATLVAQGNAVLDDSGITLDAVSARWGYWAIKNMQAQFNPDDFAGNARIPLEGEILNEQVSFPLAVVLTGVPPVEKWHIPQHYTLSVRANNVSGGLFPKPLAFDLTLLHVPGRFDIFSQDPNGIVATLLDSGAITATLGSALPLQLAMNGQIEKNTLNLEFSSINSDLSQLASCVALPFLALSEGTLRGAFRISGLIADPEFTGALSLENPAFMIPMVSKTMFRTNRILATIGQNGLTMPQTRFTTATGAVLADARLEFNRWKLSTVDLNLLTPERNYIPVDMTLALIRYKGNTGLDMSIMLEGNDMTLNGYVEATDADVELVISSVQDTLSSGDLLALFSPHQNDMAAQKQDPQLAITANLDIVVGQRVQILFNPFLRGVVVPNTPLAVSFDSTSGNFSLKGDVALRGGQIVWLNRNFYMKEGRIVFNETQDLIDPRVTVRAETRERDTSGNPVTITLSAQNQPVSTFNPQFSASPAKSETEIMVLLGQVISADSEDAREVIMAGGDYLVQSIVMSKIENALRETLHFDIFSVRTNFLQNAVKQSMDNNSTGKQVKFSNFFDNSTVYIGKYFGSSIYADALMHWTYDETRSDEAGSVGNLVFQPEFGLEMASPFVNIRWGIAPNLEAIQNNLWVPSTSITLSWKISF